jgi:hypothetical protein
MGFDSNVQSASNIFALWNLFVTFFLIVQEIVTFLSSLMTNFVSGLPSKLINMYHFQKYRLDSACEGTNAREIQAHNIGVLIYVGFVEVPEISNCFQGDTCVPSSKIRDDYSMI